MTDYPYMVANGRIPQIIDKLQTAAKPPKLTAELIKNLGFSSSNDRAIVPLLRRLGFITDDGVPTVYYDQMRDKTTSKRIFASRIKELYAELFTLNTSIYSDSDDSVKGAIARVTGKNENMVMRIFNTFKAVCALADFSIAQVTPDVAPVPVSQSENKHIKTQNEPTHHNPGNPSFHYNIQIHLPATTDISVYNAIFKSLKENLGI
jgi:hypothetical protein